MSRLLLVVSDFANSKSMYSSLIIKGLHGTWYREPSNRGPLYHNNSAMSRISWYREPSNRGPLYRRDVYM